jgi:hypothetical protein
MRARGVKSTNIADALAYTFWHAVPMVAIAIGFAEPEEV